MLITFIVIVTIAAAAGVVALALGSNGRANLQRRAGEAIAKRISDAAQWRAHGQARRLSHSQATVDHYVGTIERRTRATVEGFAWVSTFITRPILSVNHQVEEPLLVVLLADPDGGEPIMRAVALDRTGRFGRANPAVYNRIDSPIRVLGRFDHRSGQPTEPSAEPQQPTAELLRQAPVIPDTVLTAATELRHEVLADDRRVETFSRRAAKSRERLARLVRANPGLRDLDSFYGDVADTVRALEDRANEHDQPS